MATASVDPLLTYKDLQAILRVSRAQVHVMRRNGRLPRPIMVGKLPRWRRRDLDRWMEAQRA